MRELADKIDNTAPAATGRLPAAEFNAMYTELENFAKAHARTLDTDSDTVLTMISQACAAYASSGVHGLDTGGVNSYVVGKVAADLWMPYALFRGMAVRFIPSATNNGASTLNAWGLGALPIVTFDGNALAGGEIVQNRPTELFYHATIVGGTDPGFVLCPWASALGLDQGGGDPPIGGGGQTAVFNIPDTFEYHLYNDLVSRGYDLAQDITVVATLPTGGILGGGNYAFNTGSGFTAGSSLKLIISSGAHIVGAGGGGANGEQDGTGDGSPGGLALKAEDDITIDNQGTIAGGGGGGARNGAAGANWLQSPGYGGAYGAGIWTNIPANFKINNPYFFANRYWDVPGNIGVGGAAAGQWGQDGSSAGGGTVGGAAGDAVNGNSFITWTTTGTRYGTVS